MTPEEKYNLNLKFERAVETLMLRMNRHPDMKAWRDWKQANPGPFFLNTASAEAVALWKAKEAVVLAVREKEQKMWDRFQKRLKEV
jgi:hypothetical protein